MYLGSVFLFDYFWISPISDRGAMSERGAMSDNGAMSDRGADIR